MNKLYKAGLAVLAIALLTSSALAYSPVISTIPDVILNTDDLVFTNAFNWADYVSDPDTTSPSLQVVFAEGAWQGLADRSQEQTDGTATTEVTINGQNEVNYAGLGDTQVTASLTFDGTTLLGSDGWLTFRANTQPSDRAVVLIASDGATTPTASNAFEVRTDTVEPDQLTVPVQAVTLGNWDTDADFGDWVFTSIFNPTSTSGSGSVGIVSSLANSNDFAFWQLKPSATHITYSSGILRGRWTINGGSNAPAAWPAVQMRLLENNNAEQTWTNVSSNGYVPAASTSRTYETFYEPAANLPSSDITAAFYLIDTDTTQGGTSPFTLEQLEVQSLTGADSLASTVQTIDSGQSVDFTSVVNLSFYTDISGSGNADSWTYTVSGLTNVGNSAIAQINTGTTIASNTLYRVVNTVSSSQTALNQPQFELRAFPNDNSLVNVRQDVGTSAGSAHMPDSGGKDYVVLLPSSGIDGQQLDISFDIINNDNTRTGAVTWDKVVIQAIPLSSLP